MKFIVDIRHFDFRMVITRISEREKWRRRNRYIDDMRPKNRCGTKEDARLWCNLDCCGILCAFVTWALLIFAQYVTTKFIIVPWLGFSFTGMVHLTLFNSLAFLCVLLQFRTMTTDPGAVSSRAAPVKVSPVANDLDAAESGLLAQENTVSSEERKSKALKRWCHRCDTYKPSRAHHCSVCRRCIVKMDHHCPWMNNCIGIGNHKFFLQFIGYTMILCCYALVLIVCRYLACAGFWARESDADRDLVSGCLDGSVYVAVLVAESMLFGMFTACMALDQWEVITSGQTQIDKLKGEQHSSSANVHEVFGGAKKFRFDWLLPTKVAFGPEIWEEVMGHRICELSNTEMKCYVPSELPRSNWPPSVRSAILTPSAKSSTSLRGGQVRGRKSLPQTPSEANLDTASINGAIIQMITPSPKSFHIA